MHVVSEEAQVLWMGASPQGDLTQASDLGKIPSDPEDG